MEANLSIFGQIVNTAYLKRIDSLVKHWRIGVTNNSFELTDMTLVSIYAWMLIKLGKTTNLLASEVTEMVKHLVTLLNITISAAQLSDLVNTLMKGTIYANWELEGDNSTLGMQIPNYNVPLNFNNTLRYERTLSTFYIATGNEQYITLPILVNATIIQIVRETQPLTTADYGFSQLIGQISFAVSLSQNEKVFIIYGVGKNVLSTSIVPVSNLDNAIIPFVDTTTPTIPSYNTTYPAYGQYPTTILVIITDGIEQISQITPKFTRIAGLLDSISYDIGTEVSGYIVLKK